MTTINQKNCQHCKQPFFSERRSRIFCSDSCRQLAYLDRRSRKSAQASFIEEANCEEINLPPLVVNKEELQNLETICDVEQQTCDRDPSEIPFHDNQPEMLGGFKRKKINKVQNNTSGQLLLIGAAIAGMILINKFNKSESNDRKSQINEDGSCESDTEPPFINNENPNNEN